MLAIHTRLSHLYQFTPFTTELSGRRIFLTRLTRNIGKVRKV